MTIAPAVRAMLIAAVFAAPLLLAPISSAQEMGVPVYSPGTPPAGQTVQAPVGHRQPRAVDIAQANKSAADQLEERQQAELNRRLRICRGC